MKKIRSFFNGISHRSLVILNQTVFVLIILTLLYPFFINNNKKNYTGNEFIVRQAALNLFENCKIGNREECYKSGFEKLIQKHNFSFAEKTLYALQDIDEGTRSCHVLAHYMSRMAVNKNPSTWMELLDSVNVNTCGSGFLHGVLESHLGDAPRTEFNGELGNEICDRGNDPYRQRMCMHFMGHLYELNTFDDVAKAVPFCDAASPTLKFDCLDGVFMEYHQKITLEDHGMAPLPNYTPEYAGSLEKNCTKYKGQAGSACWTEMAEVYAKTYGYQANEIYNHCYNSLANPNERRSCYFKGVTLQSTYPYNVSTEKLVAICAFYKNNNDYQACTRNLISSLLYYTPKYTIRGIDLCSNINQDRHWCFMELGSQLKKFVPDAEERKMYCSPTKALNFRELCANA